MNSEDTVTTEPPHPALPLAAVARAAARSRTGGPWSVAHLRWCWLCLVAVGVILVAVAAAAAGYRAALGAGTGIGIVGAFFTLSTVAVAWVGARLPQAVLVVALGSYLVKIVALGAVIVLLPAAGPVSPRWLAFGVLAGLVAWMTTHLRYVWTAKLFYVDPH